MAISVPTAINAEILYAAHKLAKAQAPGNVDTGWIDRTGFESASLLGALGASSGGPATQSLKLELFDAEAGSDTRSDGTPASVAGGTRFFRSAWKSLRMSGSRLARP